MLPVDFVRKNNGNGFVRVILKQSLLPFLDQTSEDPNQRTSNEKVRSFHLTSRDVRLEIDPEDLEDKKNVVIEISNLEFFIAPLLDEEREQFTLEVQFVGNQCPLPTVVKEYLIA